MNKRSGIPQVLASKGSTLAKYLIRKIPGTATNNMSKLRSAARAFRSMAPEAISTGRANYLTELSAAIGAGKKFNPIPPVSERVGYNRFMGRHLAKATSRTRRSIGLAAAGGWMGTGIAIKAMLLKRLRESKNLNKKAGTTSEAVGTKMWLPLLAGSIASAGTRRKLLAKVLLASGAGSILANAGGHAAGRFSKPRTFKQQWDHDRSWSPTWKDLVIPGVAGYNKGKRNKGKHSYKDILGNI